MSLHEKYIIENSRQQKYPPVRNMSENCVPFIISVGSLKKPKTNLVNNNFLCYNCDRRGYFASHFLKKINSFGPKHKL